MRKLLSICLSVMLVLGTMSVLFALPATASETANLIVNGDADGVGGKIVYDATDAASSSYTGEIVENQAVGWRNSSPTYADVKVYYPETINADLFNNYGGSQVLGINNWRYAYQDVEIEAGKTYRVSAKITVNPKAVTGGHYAMFIDAKQQCENPAVPSDKAWYVKHDIKSEKVTDTFYGEGDFKDYSFVFNADDYIAANNLSPKANGKYHARFVMYNYSSYVVLFDDVVFQEVYDVVISAGQGGTVDTTTVALGANATIKATPYYGNSFNGWYDKNDNLVSTNATYTGTITGSLTAKFNVYNQIVDGNFESGTTAGSDAVELLPTFATKEVATLANPVNLTAGHGSSALYVKTEGGTANSAQYTVKIPVSVEKNTKYVFAFSYYAPTLASASDYGAKVVLHADKSNLNNWTASGTVKEWSLVWNNENANGTFPGPRTWTYIGNTNATFLRHTHASVGTGADKWVDVIVAFDSGESDTIFADGEDTASIWFSVGLTNYGDGSGNDTTPNFYLDNMSFTKASATAANKLTVNSSNGGTVAVADALKYPGVTYFYSTANATKGDAATVWQVAGSDTYADMMSTVKYTATANEGFAFLGWYDENDICVSTNATESFYTEGTYTAKFEATMGATDGGYVVDNGDGSKTAVPYFGNIFDAWYNAQNEVIQRTETIDANTYPDAVARFYKHNQVTDGSFEDDADSTMYIGAGASGEVLTDTDGNKFMRLTHDGAVNYVSFSWPFTVEQGKKYIVSYKVREGLDANGNKLSTADMSFRKQIRPMNAAGTNYDWVGLQFASQDYYVLANMRNSSTANADLLPSGGTMLNPATVANTTDHMLRYAKTDTDWVTFSYILDASTLNNKAGNNDYFASSNTVKLGLVLGANAAGTMVLDIDEILIAEVKEEYGISMTDPIGGHITMDRIASTEALPVTYTAYPDVDNNYSFEGWYDSTNTRVSISASYTPSAATTLTAQFKMDNLGFQTEENGYVTATPYYGNAFDGWYDAATGKTLQSTERTVAAADAANWVAKYKKGNNLLHDGAFEDVNSAAVYDAYFDYHEGSVKEIVPTYVPDSGPEFGNYCLQVTPKQATNNGKIKGLLNIPVDVEAGKTYLWKFSYAITTGSYMQDRDHLNFSVDQANVAGGVSWTPDTAAGINNVDYSFHFEKHSVDMSTNGWTWGAVKTPAGSTQTAWSRDYKFSAINEWLDVYVLFTPVASGKHYLSMGTTASQTNLFVFDNMSLSEVEANSTPTSVTAEANGSVASYRTDDPAYLVSGAPAGDDISTSGRVDLNNPYYSNFYASYYAVPDLGYTFDGWYKDGFKVSSDKEIILKTVDGGSYVAKFTLDNNTYYANAETEAENGVYGGYVTGTTSYTELVNGQTAEFSAVAYNGNTFKGWYNKATGKLLSTEANYTHTATENVTLVAKFNLENKFNDSGYENTELSADIWGEGKEWYATVASGNYDASINAAFKYSGNNALNIYAPKATVRHAAMDVTANATYHLSFYWKGSSATIAPSYVKVYNAADMTELASFDAFNPSADKAWQKFYLNFNTGAATSVIVEFKYEDEGSIYFDDLALFNTANADFTVNTTLEKQGDIFPGYIATEDTIVSAFGSSITVTAVPYELNTFLGWYENGVKVSDAASYTFTLESNCDLVAKFSVRNIYPDSGAENTEQGVSLSHKYTDWVVNESQYEQWGFDVTAMDTPDAFDGDVVINALHRTTNYSTTLKGLKENTNYVFSFWWCFKQGGTFDTAVINGVQTGKELARGMGGTADGNWQQVVIPFYSEQNTEITLTFKYTAGSGACMMDNFALYESDFVGVYATEGGSVVSDLNGGANGPADRGAQVTVTATPDAGHTFKGWYNYKNLQEVLSTDLTYTFTVTGPKYVIAYFEGPDAEEMNYFVDGDFENNCFEGVIFSHPFYTVEWCSYTVVKSNSDKTILPVSGEKMLTMSAQSRMSNIHIQNLTPNADYTLSFYYNADPGASVESVRINRYLNESDDRLNQDDPKHPHETSWMLNMSVADYVSEYCLNVALFSSSNSGQWRRAEISFNAGNRGEILMAIGMGRSIGSGAIYFDDIRLTEGNTQSDNKLGNGNFEDASNTKGWEGDYTTATEGGNTYGVSSGEISNAFFMDYATAHSSTISFKAKSSNGAVLAYGMTPAGALSLFDANGVNNATSNTSYATVALTDEWTEYSINVANNGLESYKFFLKSMNGGEFMIDDASIKIAQERIDVEKYTFEADTNTHIDKNASVLHADNEYNNEYFQITDTVSKNGSASLMMTNASLTGGEYNRHMLAMDWTFLELFSGRRYSVSFWAKAENVGDEFHVHAYATDDDWARLDLINEDVVATSTDWTYYTFEFSNINLNAAPRMVKIGVGDTDNVNTGNVYFDDITISEASTVVTGEASKLYTEDISQNYFKNPSFEKADSLTDAYVKSGDAFYGDKYITLEAGDKIVIPVNTKPDFEVKYWKGDYTFAASVRGNANADGYIGVSFTPDGSNLMTDADGNAAVLAVNTNGKWARSGFNFTDYRWTYLYLVIECTAGTFDVDYVSMFNQLRSFKENPQLVDTTVEFTDYEDMSAHDKGNYIGGNITGLPEDSYVVLVGDKTLYAAIDNETGRYDIKNIPNDTYAMMVAPGGAAFMTEWGDLVVTDEGISGLACERLNGAVTEVSGQGVRNGIVKIVDDDSEWAYFTTTGADGMYTAYILECSWYIAGTTKDPEVVKDYKLDMEAFTFNAKDASVNAATVTGEPAPLNSDPSLPIAAVITVMLSAAALIVLTFKKGECK